MDSLTTLPSIALVVHLSETEASGSIAERTRLMISSLRGGGLPATWILNQPRQIERLGAETLATAGNAVGLTAFARSPQRLRRELADHQSAVRAATGHDVGVIVGDPRQLRARAAILAELGIRAMVSATASAESTAARPLPCGIWQLDPMVSFPSTRRWPFLPARRPSVQQLVSRKLADQLLLISVELDRCHARDLRVCQQLLEEIAQWNREHRLTVTTVSAAALQLSEQHEIRPQRSILRTAA